MSSSMDRRLSPCPTSRRRLRGVVARGRRQHRRKRPLSTHDPAKRRSEDEEVMKHQKQCGEVSARLARTVLAGAALATASTTAALLWSGCGAVSALEMAVA